MKNIKRIITNVSLNFLPRINESKIRYITFQHHSFKLFETKTHVQEINDSEFCRKNPQQ